MADLSSSIYLLIERTVTDLPADAERAIAKAEKRETNKLAKLQLSLILKNIKLGRAKKIPLCQDTGTPIFHLKANNARQAQKIKLAAILAVKKATSEGLLRPNIVDALTRKNKGNVGKLVPVFDVELVSGSARDCEVAFVAKGAGSENCSRLAMLNPGESVEEYVLGEVKKIGGKPCAPYILGIGIGGTADLAARLAKKACMREIGKKSADRDVRKLEEGLERLINRTGIGTMGLGGDTTCLAVNVETADCHTGSLPIALCFMCWADRRRSVRLRV